MGVIGETSRVPKGDNLEEFHFWSTLSQYARPYWVGAVFASVGSFLCGIAVALQPLVIKFIVDQGINRPNATEGKRFLYAAGFVGVYMLLSGLRIGIWRLGYKRFVKLIESLLFDIRSQFFRHIQGLCFRFYDQVSSGELFNYIMGSPINSIKTFLQQFILNVPYQVVSIGVALATLVCFDLPMTLILLATVASILAVRRSSRRTMHVLSANFMKEESAVSKYVSDILRGTREIKIHAIEDHISETFDNYIERIKEQSQIVSLRQQFEYIKPEGLQYAGIALIYAAGAYSCIYRGMTVGALFAFVSSVNVLLMPLMNFFQLNLVKANAEAGLERIMRIMQTETSVEDPPASVALTITEQEKRARLESLPFIEFRNVTFGYGEQPVLRDVSCRIGLGENVALVGPSGSGKTTFVRLILRLYDVNRGSILLYGRDYRQYPLRDLRSLFGVVSQDTFLFQTTLLDNIRAAAPTASLEEVRRAMDLAHVTEFLADLPHGEYTEVGENGFTLSGGQRQRVAIARAVLGKHLAFIFDEATSALDNQSERRIQQAMTDLGKNHTMIIIAHRLSTIRNVDRILVFDKGRIVQEGTYNELSTQPGLFETLLRHGI